ncbi:MAG: energy transducer TonB [Desulfobacteraceae bacterium]|nr:energy transducer TonB [Desulfobacteraceae bacterium]
MDDIELSACGLDPLRFRVLGECAAIDGLEFIPSPAGDAGEAACIIRDVDVSESGVHGGISRRPKKSRVLLGMGLSLGIHAAVLLLAVLSAVLLRPLWVPEPRFIMASIVSAGDFCGVSKGAAGGAPGGDAGPAAIGGGAEKSEMRAAPPEPGRPPEPDPIPVEEFHGEQSPKPPEPQPPAEPPKVSRTPRKAAAPHSGEKPSRRPAAQTPCSTNAKQERPDAAAAQDRSRPVESEGVNPRDGAAGGQAGTYASGGGGPQDRGGSGGTRGEYELNKVETAPTALRKVEPEFPRIARQMGISGRVVVRFLVKTDGSVARASVIEANPKGVFEQSVLDAVDKWRFKPGRYGGAAVATWIVQPIQFRLSR